MPCDVTDHEVWIQLPVGERPDQDGVAFGGHPSLQSGGHHANKLQSQGVAEFVLEFFSGVQTECHSDHAASGTAVQAVGVA